MTNPVWFSVAIMSNNDNTNDHQLYLRAVIRDESGEEYGLMRRMFRKIQTSGVTMKTQQLCILKLKCKK